MSGLFLTIVVVLGAATIVCGCPMMCADEYYKNKRRKEAEEAFDRMEASPPETGLPKKILKFETAMKDISITV